MFGKLGVSVFFEFDVISIEESNFVKMHEFLPIIFILQVLQERYSTHWLKKKSSTVKIWL